MYNMGVILYLLLFGYFMMVSYAVQSLPGKPINIRVLADSFNIGVQWEPPNDTFGAIRNYIVSFAILPNKTEFSNIVDGQDSLSIIPVGTHIGRLFRIRVSAENDVGIGPYSDVRYIRINCSGTYDVYPNTSVKIFSPGHETRNPLEPGVMCSWRLKATPFYVIEIKIDAITLVNNSSLRETANCSNTRTFINVEGIGKYCDESDFDKSAKRTPLDDLTVTLKTGLNAGGRGFELTATSVIRLPGPPRNIKVSSSDHAVIVTWQQPMEDTLPVTSYVIRYYVLQGGDSYKVTISPAMRRFSLNVDRFEGRFLGINMSAAIGFQEGKQSNPVFIRAPCRRKLFIATGNSMNITSPNYPRLYPRSIMCIWEVTSDPEVNLYVKILDFRLEDTSFCSSDYVLFSFKENKEPECSRMITPWETNTRCSAFNMTFVSDEKNQFEGFLMQVEAQGKNSKTPTASSITNLEMSTLYKQRTSKEPEISAGYHTPTSTRSASVISKISTMSSASLHSITTNSLNGENSTTTSDYVSVQRNTKPGTSKYNIEGQGELTQGQAINGMTSSDNRSTKETFNSNTDLIIKTTTTTTVYGTSDTFGNSDVTKPSQTRETFRTYSKLNSVGSELEQLALTAVSISNIDDAGDVTTLYPDLSKTKNGSQGLDGVNVDPRQHTEHMTGEIVGSVTAVVVLLLLFVGFYRCRRKRQKMKIDIDRSDKYTLGHVELHDIIKLSKLNQPNNYETFDVTNMQETSFTTEKNIRMLQDESYHGNKGCGTLSQKPTRRKHYSFPYSTKNRKVHQEIDKTLSAFHFIEDKQELETQIRRKQKRRRTNSL